MAEFSGTPHGAGRKIAVAVSRFNEDVTQKLVEGALDALTRHRVYQQPSARLVCRLWPKRKANSNRD